MGTWLAPAHQYLLRNAISAVLVISALYINLIKDLIIMRLLKRKGKDTQGIRKERKSKKNSCKGQVDLAP